MAGNEHSHNVGEKRPWQEPAIDVIASIADVSAKIGTENDEDFTGLPLPS